MPKKLRLADYKAPDYVTIKTDLEITIDEPKTLVKGKLQLKKSSIAIGNELRLNGAGQKITYLKLNDQELNAQEYLEDKDLVLHPEQEDVLIEIHNEIDPINNKSFEGIYAADGNYLSQCEAEGFRKILYYQDRPDVLSTFTTSIIADSKFNSLLSNGNLIEEKTLDNGKQQVVWHDPYPKPSYLFALVCGQFEKIDDHFTTKSGNKVLLEIYVDPGNTKKAAHAMQSLKDSMKWDEKRFDLEYDLDRYMIVATDTFNSGAMENKGLNIFNSKYVLADEESATDKDFYNIQAVVGHEYFHNWTGNRVTCRDWFQLSLKEGLTVFRDQEFSSDMNSRPVKRIDDVIRLRKAQFPEDQGPNSHPVRPKEALNISNFYTATIYEKGAEIIRMIHTLIGEKAFQQGMKKYFELFDGQAVRTEDFCRAMQEASGKDLSFFQKWYSQAGTPKIKMEKHANTLEIQQLQSPLLIPLKLGFIDQNGKPAEPKVLSSSCDYQSKAKDYLFELTKEKESLEFDSLEGLEISLLRDFSAPIEVDFPQSMPSLVHLATHDTNSFSQWDAAYRVLKTTFKNAIASIENNVAIKEPTELIQLYQAELSKKREDMEFSSLFIKNIQFENIALDYTELPIDAFFQAKAEIETSLATALEKQLRHRYEEVAAIKTPEARSLKNQILYYLSMVDSSYASKQFTTSTNMTDTLGALRSLSGNDKESFQQHLSSFYQTWKNDALTITKYFQLLFGQEDVSVLDEIEKLDPKVYDRFMPNHNYSVYGTIGLSNTKVFHHPDGRTYQLMAQRIAELDKDNPTVAARLAACFNDYPRLDQKRKTIMKRAIDNVLDPDKLSSNTYEILSKTIKE